MRKGIAFGVAFALAVAAMVLGAFGVLIESGARAHGVVERYASAAAVVHGEQSATYVRGSGDDKSSDSRPLVEPNRVPVAQAGALRAVAGGRRCGRGFLGAGGCGGGVGFGVRCGFGIWLGAWCGIWFRFGFGIAIWIWLGIRFWCGRCRRAHTDRARLGLREAGADRVGVGARAGLRA